MKISEFFEENNRIAIAFSGGVDSSYLLYAARKCTVKAYYVRSQFQPEFELRDAIRLASELEIDMEVISVDILRDANVKANPENRCYYCKRRIFEAVIKAAEADGFKIICDGTNASDPEEDRPGMKALRELKVMSPLRMAELTKDDIRRLSKEAGLFTWDKPAYACLATRIPWSEEITLEKLQKTENAESYMFTQGFIDFRIRLRGNTGILQLKKEQIEKYLNQRCVIDSELLKYYDKMILDEEGR